MASVPNLIRDVLEKAGLSTGAWDVAPEGLEEMYPGLPRALYALAAAVDNLPTLTSTETLDLAGVLAIRKDSKNSMYRDIKEGRFPPPVKIRNRSVWLKAEVDAWLANLAAAR